MNAILGPIIGSAIGSLVTAFVAWSSHRRSDRLSHTEKAEAEAAKAEAEAAKSREQREAHVDDLLLRLSKIDKWLSPHTYVSLKDADAVNLEFEKVREILVETRALIEARFPSLRQQHQELSLCAETYKFWLVAAVSSEIGLHQHQQMMKVSAIGLSTATDLRFSLVVERNTETQSLRKSESHCGANGGQNALVQRLFEGFPWAHNS